MKKDTKTKQKWVTSLEYLKLADTVHRLLQRVDILENLLKLPTTLKNIDVTLQMYQGLLHDINDSLEMLTQKKQSRKIKRNPKTL